MNEGDLEFEPHDLPHRRGTRRLIICTPPSSAFLGQVPEEFKRCEDAEYLMSVARRCVHHLVNLVYRPTSPEGASKDDEFSRRSIEERWLTSYRDTVQALRHPGVLERAAGCDAGIFVFDSQRMAVETGGSTAYRDCSAPAPSPRKWPAVILAFFDGRIRNGNRLMSTELHLKYSCSIR